MGWRVSTSSVGGWHKYIQGNKREYSDNGKSRGGSEVTRDRWYRWCWRKEETRKGRVNLRDVTALTGAHTRQSNSHAEQRSKGKRREATTTRHKHIPFRPWGQLNGKGGNIRGDGNIRQRRGRGLNHLLARGGLARLERLRDGDTWQLLNGSLQQDP